MGTYVVTGGNGFIGECVKSQLLKDKHNVVVASRNKILGGECDWVEFDLRDRSTIKNITNIRPDGIFHLAWSTTPATAELDPALDVSTNLAGTIDLLKSASELDNVKVVLVSSGGTVYGVTSEVTISETHPLNPIGFYGMTKRAMEFYALQCHQLDNVDLRIVRVSNPFGAAQGFAKMQGAASIFARRIIRDEVINIWGDGSNVRDYVDVKDVAAGIIAIMNVPASNKSSFPVFNLGSGVGISLLELLNIIEDAAKRRAKISYHAPRQFDLPFNVLNIEKIKRLTGWSPGSVVDQISMFVRSLQ